jgi:ankyrin repeat protein
MGRTPLNNAADKGHVEVVRLLLEAGADISIVDFDGRTPLNNAADQGQKFVKDYKIISTTQN